MYWNWKLSGLALAGAFLLAVVLVKPIGVSTQFVILDALVASWLNPDLVVEDATSASGYASSNAYLDRSEGKYAQSVANPLNYSFVFVIAMVIGGFLGRRLQGGAREPVPPFHSARFGHTRALRYGLAFAGGILVLWGARLAGGCTSGHMMSGMMQTAVSGYVFALAAFVFAVPTALLLYRDGGNAS